MTSLARPTFADLAPPPPVASQLSDAFSSSFHLDPSRRFPPSVHSPDFRLDGTEAGNGGPKFAWGESRGPEGRGRRSTSDDRLSLGEGRLPPDFDSDEHEDVMSQSTPMPTGAAEHEEDETPTPKIDQNGHVRREGLPGKGRPPVRHPFAHTTGLLRVIGPSEDTEEEESSDDLLALPPQTEAFFRPRATSTSSSIPSFRSSLQIQTHSNGRTSPSGTAINGNGPFAKEVRIPRFRTVGQKAGGFVVYECEIKTWQGTTLRPWRRYSSFVTLREDLISEVPKLRRNVSSLPPKSSLAKFRPSFLERRRKQLAFWLNEVLLHPDLGGTEAARKWVLRDGDGSAIGAAGPDSAG